MSFQRLNSFFLIAFFVNCMLINLLLPLQGIPQVRKYIDNHVSLINSAEFNDTCYDDLQPLASAIGEKRVVMLGELFHGDGETMKLKSRVVRFLHEKMGFNVIVFESDFFALNDGYDAFKRKKLSFDSLLYLSVFPIWTKCQQTHELFRYLKENAIGQHKMVISGVDNRGISGYSLRYMKNAIDIFLKETDIPFVSDPAYPNFINMLGKSHSFLYGRNKSALDSIITLLPGIIRQVEQKNVPGEKLRISFYLNVLKGFLVNCELSAYYYYSEAYKIHHKHHALHDFQLAENLRWLTSEKFADEKIIVWAHNTHIEKGSGEHLLYSGYNSMGYLFTRDSINSAQTYVIGVTCYEGEGQLATRDITEKVTKPNKKSIESWIHSKGFRYAFTDLTGINACIGTDSPFFMKTYINTESRQDWTKFYDGVLYIKTSKSCIHQDLINIK